jgi:hypothetical protein
MATWRDKKLNQGICPICDKRALTEGRAACEICLERHAKASRRYRRKNKSTYNAYMRKYMRDYRLAKAKAKKASTKASEPPQALVTTHQGYASAPTREWLLARLATLSDASQS